MLAIRGIIHHKISPFVGKFFTKSCCLWYNSSWNLSICGKIPHRSSTSLCGI